MTEIRAFVGHSFGPNDEIVVQTFLKYFDQVSGILPSFTWSSAKASEPTELGKKVMSLTADRNAFIGICTKKERVVCDEKLYQPFYSRQLLQGQSTDYAWKTSDWVIQEIGLAVGRGLPIIILLEKGCRKPGGIQGDVEFISFDREAPLQACGQLLEMIRSLSPPIRSQETASTEGPAESLVPSEAVVEPEKDEMPDDTWDQKKFENAFVWQMLIKEDAEKAEKIDNAFLDSDYANDAVKKSEWLAMREYWRIRSPTGGSLNAIKKLHNDYPNNADITSTLADALSYFGRNLEAAQKNMLAAELENVDVSRSQDHKRVAAIRFAREKEFEISHSILNQQKYNIFENPDQELKILNTVRDVAVIEGDDDVAVQAMERILEINPDDFDTRFSLAYKYSEKENHDLSFYHYLKIPSNKRSSVVWNNLGVGFQHFSLPAKSVSAYCKSADAGETLAMSNLGYKLMQAGFLAEAETEFGRALVIADFHKNVGEGMAALRDVRENETKRQVEILEKASKKISFFQKLGRAVAKPDATTIHDAWKGPECPLTLSIDGSLFCAFGKYERAPSSLLKGLLGEAVKPTQHEVEYTGTICGNRIIGTVKRTKIGKKATTSSIIGGADVDVKFALVIDDENLKISVAENLKHTEPMFYDFHQI